MAYIYQAGLYCDDCGREIIADLDRRGTEDTEDSDDYPQYAPDGGGEADSPQHCEAGPTCKNAITLRQRDPATGKRRTYRIGAWLENDLTEAGAEYVRAAVREPHGLCRRLWREWYGLVD